MASERESDVQETAVTQLVDRSNNFGGIEVKIVRSLLVENF